MPRLPRTAVPAAALALLAGLGWSRGPSPAADPPAPAGSAVGRAGCAAAACHGGPAAESLARDEYPDRWQCSATHWDAADPHRRAYAVLDGELARHIMARYAGGKPATEDARCLACHANPSLAGPVAAGLVSLRREGVACEACHGDAGDWLHPHTAPTWRTAGRPALGFADLNDIGVRAETCLGCHVGAPADPARGYPVRDMNHDMIAAGHPRLNFDLADYLDRLPKHWNERDRASVPPAPRGPAFGVKGWLVGRVAHAEAAARLLADRAARADPWPEFAESNCFACHHALTPDSGRPPSGRTLGVAGWQPVWPVTQPGGRPGPFASAAVGELLRTVEGRRPANRDLIRAKASTVAVELHAVHEQFGRAADADAVSAAARLFDRVNTDRLDWDEACQVAHGLAALERARLRQTPGAKVMPGFAAAFRLLTLPRDPDRFDSPRGFDPAAVRGTLDELLKAVPPAAEKALR